MVYGFNVVASKDTEKLAKQLEVPMKNYSIIYKLMDDIRDELSSRLPELPEETFVGEANVLMVFQLTGQRKALAAGCRVKKGTLTADKDSVWKVIRNEQVIHQGKMELPQFAVVRFSFTLLFFALPNVYLLGALTRSVFSQPNVPIVMLDSDHTCFQQHS